MTGCKVGLSASPLSSWPPVANGRLQTLEGSISLLILIPLATSSQDGVLRSWDFDQGGAPMQEFVGHGAEVVSLQFDDVKLLSAAKDGSIRCWDLR